MSIPRPVSGVRAAGGRIRQVMVHTSLRVRLVAALTALVAAALLGAGLAATTIMRSYLTGRVDSQLRSAAESAAVNVRNGDFTGPTVGPSADGGSDRGGRGRDSGHTLISAYVLKVLNTSGATVYGPSHELIDKSEPLPNLPTETAARSTADGTLVRTIGAVSGGESWRLLVEPVTLSDGSKGTLLIATSLGDVEGTVSRLALVMLAIGAVAVVLLAGVGHLVVRASLRPLREVERTAAAIALGDLGRRVPRAHERNEVGSLARSLNTMLTEIEDSFAARAASETAARTSEARMRQFVADASHELRTPLTTIRGFAELYRQPVGHRRPDVDRFMSRIEGEASRMGLLVEDLLLLARLDQQRPLRTDPVDLLALLSDTVHDAQLSASGKTLSFRLGATDPPPIVLGDEARLRQVFANLITNAIQHTPAGTRIDVLLETVVEGSPRAHAVITDNGPGIAPEHAARAFERFYRVDSARAREDGGSGLGLAIVSALVTGHRGAVWLDSTVGDGASFHVELPLIDGSAEPTVTSPSTHSSTPEAHPPAT